MKREDIQAAADKLTEALALLSEPAGKSILAEISRLDLLVSQYDAGAYVEIQPDGSGYHWTAVIPVFGNPERLTRRLGFSRLADIPTYATTAWEGMPLVVSSQWAQRWVGHTVRKLEAMGLTVIVED
jgi:hypothetical protein